MAELSGKVVLLTGASGEIGAETARRLASEGARLVLSGRREARLQELAEEIARSGAAARPVALRADLSVRGEAEALVAGAVERAGQLDVLINNAGTSMQGLAWRCGDRDAARAVFEANLWAPLALVAAVAPAMVARGEGTIVNIGSLARVSPFPHLGVYAGSRAALASVTEVLDIELGARGVNVVEVALGPVDTPSSRENRVLAGADRWLDGRPGLGTAEAAADTIVRAVRDGARGVVFYPRVLRWVHRFPGLGRRYARRAARHADLRDETLRAGGVAYQEAS